jgi:hypothetical protein
MMTELTRQEDQLYVDRARVQDIGEGEFYQNNDDRAEKDLNKSRSLQIVNSPAALFSTADIGDLRMRWASVQTGFVDEPRWAVQEADKLVGTVVERLTEGFASERSALEKQWDRGDSVSTEELRLALQRYRTFFDRLLNV